jgi:hypothetical protein
VFPTSPGWAIIAISARSSQSTCQQSQSSRPVLGQLLQFLLQFCEQYKHSPDSLGEPSLSMPGKTSST